MSRDFECPRCGAKYDNEQNLKAHLACVHACIFPGCKWLLVDQAELSSHLAEAHGVEQYSGVDLEIPEPMFRPLSSSPQTPTEAEDLYRWLWKVCLLIAEAGRPETALATARHTFPQQVAFVTQNFNRVATTVKLSRYTRLKTSEAKASYLVAVLAHREYKPAYALQKIKPSDILAVVRG